MKRIAGLQWNGPLRVLSTPKSRLHTLARAEQQLKMCAYKGKGAGASAQYADENAAAQPQLTQHSYQATHSPYQATFIPSNPFAIPSNPFAVPSNPICRTKRPICHTKQPIRHTKQHSYQATHLPACTCRQRCSSPWRPRQGT